MAGRLLERNEERRPFDRRDGGTVFGFAGGYREHGRTVGMARIHAGRPRLRISALSGSRGRTMDSFLRKRTEEGFQNRYGAKRNEELFERVQEQVQRESAMLFIV